MADTWATATMLVAITVPPSACHSTSGSSSSQASSRSGSTSSGSRLPKARYSLRSSKSSPRHCAASRRSRTDSSARVCKGNLVIFTLATCPVPRLMGDWPFNDSPSCFVTSCRHQPQTVVQFLQLQGHASVHSTHRGIRCANVRPFIGHLSPSASEALRSLAASRTFT